jgi:hypothetical protein
MPAPGISPALSVADSPATWQASPGTGHRLDHSPRLAGAPERPVLHVQDRTTRSTVGAPERWLSARRLPESPSRTVTNGERSWSCRNFVCATRWAGCSCRCLGLALRPRAEAAPPASLAVPPPGRSGGSRRTRCRRPTTRSGRAGAQYRTGDDPVRATSIGQPCDVAFLVVFQVEIGWKIDVDHLSVLPGRCGAVLEPDGHL